MNMGFCWSKEGFDFMRYKQKFDNEIFILYQKEANYG